jgi:hypothetical protein
MAVPRDTSVEPVLETGDGLCGDKNPRVLTGVCSDGAAGEAEHNLAKIQPAGIVHGCIISAIIPPG